MQKQNTRADRYAVIKLNACSTPTLVLLLSRGSVELRLSATAVAVVVGCLGALVVGCLGAAAIFFLGAVVGCSAAAVFSFSGGGGCWVGTGTAVFFSQLSVN